jgi:hypothetical protein
VLVVGGCYDLLFNILFYFRLHLRSLAHSLDVHLIDTGIAGAVLLVLVLILVVVLRRRPRRNHKDAIALQPMAGKLHTSGCCPTASAFLFQFSVE